jgi:antitoxin component of MazEF toxin-antitoxin module
MATQSKEEVKIQIGDEVTILKGDDLISFNNMRAEIAAENEAKKAEAEAKATAKAALLKKLGITTDEAKLLLG